MKLQWDFNNQCFMTFPRWLGGAGNSSNCDPPKYLWDSPNLSLATYKTWIFFLFEAWGFHGDLLRFVQIHAGVFFCRRILKNIWCFFIFLKVGVPIRHVVTTPGISNIHHHPYHPHLQWSPRNRVPSPRPSLWTTSIMRFSISMIFFAQKKTKRVGGWTNPSEKYYIVKLDHFPRVRDENNTYLKPPGS